MSNNIRPSRARTVLVGLGLGCAVVLSGCGGGSDASSDASSASAGAGGQASSAKAKVTSSEQVCALLSTDQVASILGTQVDPGEPGDMGSPACNWWAVDQAGSGLNVQDGGASGVLSFGTLVKNGTMQGEKVDGIGDVAYWDYSMGEDKPSLRFITGGDGFYIAINRLDVADPKAAETKVANDIIAKL